MRAKHMGVVTLFILSSLAFTSRIAAQPALAPPVDTTINGALTLNGSINQGFRVEYNVNSPNVIGGYSGNFVGGGAYGATIGGGGYAGFVNSVTGIMGTVSGGYLNTASGYASAVGGGRNNTTSGDYSAVGGGFVNTASGFYSAISGGDGNAASGDYSAVGGGNVNTASGNYSAIGGGSNNEANGLYSAAGGGYINTASGNYSAIGGGFVNTTSGLYSAVGGGGANHATADITTIPGGYAASASQYGQMAYASGRFAVIGDAQTSVYVLRRYTTDNVDHYLYLDGTEVGVGPQMTLPGYSTWTFDILITALTDTGISAGYRAEGVIENQGGTTAFIGAPAVTTLGLDGGVSGWTVSLEANDTNDTLSIRVNGDTATNIRWVATVRTVEVTFPPP